jgi:hypothetical protein
MIARGNQPPQTVGEATDNGWEWLSIRCAICRHVGRIELKNRKRPEKLAAILTAARCTPCRRRTMIDAKIGMQWRTDHEMPIVFEHGRVFKAGMNGIWEIVIVTLRFWATTDRCRRLGRSRTHFSNNVGRRLLKLVIVERVICFEP